MHPSHEQLEEEREWKPAYEHARGEERWTGEDRRPIEKRHDREMAGQVSDEVYRDYRLEREREQERVSLEMERARTDYNRMDAARLEERALPPFMRRRVPLRTALQHHLDLTRRELAYPGGRGKAFPLGLAVPPSLLERERARMKRDYPLDKDALVAPFKMYRSMESPPKPSFEPISRSRPTLRVRKRERERDRTRKTPRRDERGEEKSADFQREEPGSSRRGEKRSSRKRGSRSSRNKEASERQQETADTKSEPKPPSEKTETSGTLATGEGVADTITSENNTGAQEVYPQVVQVMQEGEGNQGSEKEILSGSQSEDTATKTTEEEKNIKFPPKHLQREKLLAMKEKLQTQTQKEEPHPHSSKSKSGERGERKRRSRSRSRDREPRAGRKRRSRSRERRRAHSRDEMAREKEGVSIREVGRDRIIREREDIPRRDSPPYLRERQLLAIEREREILRARARMSLPSPATLDAIRDRSPLHVGSFDPRRPIITPYMRARALDELRRERLDRGVPPGFRGQFLYQDPRP